MRASWFPMRSSSASSRSGWPSPTAPAASSWTGCPAPSPRPRPWLEISDDVIEARLTGRRTCHACGATYHVVTAPPQKEDICDKCGGVLEQRKDDLPETVKHRLEVYHSETEPLKGFYEGKGVLKRVPDLGGIDETNAKIMELLGK